MIQRVYGFAILIGLIAAFGLSAPARAQQPFVDKFVLSDTIQPVTASELDRAIARANSDGAHALLVELNTPGGLLDSTRIMAGAILSSRVPVIVYVAPEGGRAGSAGFFLLEAADIAAMAPGTNAGAAHPVAELGPQPDATMSSYTAQEALDQHLIDLIASNDAELLAALDGRTITRLDGGKLTLHLAGARIELVQPTVREELLGWLINPNIALLLLVCGALLIYLEFNVPGTIVPGALGTLMVLLSVFALNLLPIHYTAVLLLVAALVFILLEAKFGGHGALAIAGIVCLTFGMLTLVAAPVPEMAVSPWVALSVSAAFGCITVFLVRLATRARRMKSRLGPSALVGCQATAMEALAPEGHVLVEGEIWNAFSTESVPAGSPVRVVGLENYQLRVEPLQPQSSEQPPV